LVVAHGVLLAYLVVLRLTLKFLVLLRPFVTTASLTIIFIVSIIIKLHNIQHVVMSAKRNIDKPQESDSNFFKKNIKGF
jgi:hypothetical protein